MASLATKRRTLERGEMTREEELELLIAEQAADDTYHIRQPEGVLSLQSAAPAAFEGTIEDYIGVDETGSLVSFLPRVEESLFSVGFVHGTLTAYKKRKCRCTKCRAANAEWKRNHARAQRRVRWAV
jgi:hypothetical protein